MKRKDVIMSGLHSLIVISLTLVAIFVPQFLAMYYDAKQKQDSNEFEYDYR